MRLIDLTNQKFNLITVLERVPESNPVKWRCQCDCGNIFIAEGRNIRNGHTKSCGCLKKQTAFKMGKSNSKDLSGQKFGYLTAIEPTNKRSGNCIVWKCQCDCGNTEHYVASADLLGGKIKSCGCQKYNKDCFIIEMIGKKFGKLAVLEKANKDSDGSYNYLCQCECGNKKIINGVSLRKGITTSCGCINYSIGEKYIKEILEKHQIKFQQEYKIIELNNKRFDFAIFNEDKVIRFVEFDGRQHYEPYINKEWENNCPLEERQKRDQIKNEYALSHNIPLVRIPYWERDNITLEMIMGDKYLVKPNG